MPRKIILSNSQSPGDIVMLTAAVRDLHLCHPRKFLTDVRTPYPDFWRNNPYITPLIEGEAEIIECRYPLVHQSNQRPYHFIHGFMEYLSERLGLRVVPRHFKGDIHLSKDEKIADPRFTEATNEPFWIIVAGGKNDYTIKWWSAQRFQQVVDALRGRIRFVQVGAAEHHHPPLQGTLDLRGKTSLRDLVRLTYHAQGVLCPVTLHMHLAAAVEIPPGRLKNRPCVVVAGGRESPHWESYPTHQFIHTVGTLKCCQQGGCWRARTLPLGDRDVKDLAKNRCVDVVGPLPRCMDMITVDSVLQRMELYLSRH